MLILRLPKQSSGDNQDKKYQDAFQQSRRLDDASTNTKKILAGPDKKLSNAQSDGEDRLV